MTTKHNNGQRTKNGLDERINRTQKLVKKLKTEYYQTLQQVQELQTEARREEWKPHEYQHKLKQLLYGHPRLEDYQKAQEALIREYETNVAELYHEDLSGELESYETPSLWKKQYQRISQLAWEVTRTPIFQKLSYAVGIVLILGVLGLFTYTGHVALESQAPNYLTLEQVFTENSSIPLNLTLLKSLSLSGQLTGNRNAKIYLEGILDNKTKRYLVLNGRYLQANKEITEGVVTGQVVRQNLGVVFVLATDKEQYESGEAVHIITAPENNYRSLYLVDQDNQTTPLEEDNVTIEKEGTYKVIALITAESITERLEAGFEVKKSKKKDDEKKKEEQKTYNFKNHCLESCALPKGLSDLHLTVEISDAETTVALERLTYRKYDGNQLPVQITAIPDQTAYLGQNNTLNLGQYFSDPDGETLSYRTSSVTLPITLQDAILTITGQETGNYKLFIYANDGKDITTSNHFTITVKEAPPLITIKTECGMCKESLLPSFTEIKLSVTAEKTGKWKRTTLYVDLPPGWIITNQVDGEVSVIGEEHPRIEWQLEKIEDRVQKTFHARSPTIQDKTPQNLTTTLFEESYLHLVTIISELDLEQEKHELQEKLNNTQNVTIQEIKPYGENYSVKIQIDKSQVQIENLYTLEEIQDVSLTNTSNLSMMYETREAATPILAVNSLNASNATITLPKTADVEAIARCEKWNFETAQCDSEWEVIEANYSENNETATIIVPGFSAYIGLGKSLTKRFYLSRAIDTYTLHSFKNKTSGFTKTPIFYPTPYLYPGNGSYTAEFWIRTDYNDSSIFISSGEGLNYSKYWKMGMDIQERGILTININEGIADPPLEIPVVPIHGPRSIGSTTLNDNKWHHIAFVRDKAQNIISGYVNGMVDIEFQDPTQDISDASVTHNGLLLGKSVLNPDISTEEEYIGDIAVTGVYPYALTLEEVQQHYQTQRPKFEGVTT